MNKLSEAARSALIATTTRRQGAAVRSDDPVVVTELYSLGLIGTQGGLTSKGTIARDRAMRQAEDAAFGA